jgi:hypothetical protein
VRLLLEREEDVIAILVLFEPVLVQAAGGMHLDANLAAVTARLNVERGIASLNRERRACSYRIGLLPIMPSRLGKGWEAGKRKRGCRK